MADWMVTYTFKPNEKFQDDITHHKLISCSNKKNVEIVLRHTVKNPEYLEIIEVVSAKVWDKRIQKEREGE